MPPADAGIEAAIRSVGPLAEVPLGEPGQVLGDDLVASYVERATAVVDPDGPRDLTVAYTPLHGVGAAVLTAAFARGRLPDARGGARRRPSRTRRSRPCRSPTRRSRARWTG